MNWLDDGFLLIALLTMVASTLIMILYRLQYKKTQHLEVNNGCKNNNEKNGKISYESLSKNVSLNNEKLKDSEPSKFNETVVSNEDEEYHESCIDQSRKKDSMDETDMKTVTECSGYGSNEEILRNLMIHTSDKSQHNLDTSNSILKNVPPESISSENSYSIEHETYNVSIETDTSDLQKLNIESTEDEGNESHVESSPEELKKKTFFSDRKHKNYRRFDPIEMSNFENNENEQSSTEMNTRRSHQLTISSSSSGYSDSLPSSIHTDDYSFQDIQYKEDYDDTSYNSTSLNDEMNRAFIEYDI